MKLQSVKIENLGNVKNLAFDITRDIVVLPQKEYRDILLGLSRAVSKRLFYDILDREAIKEGTHVCGEFVFKDEQWRVESSYNFEYTEEKRGKYVIRNGQKLAETYNRNGEKTVLSSKEYSALHIPVDENARFWFCNGRKIDGEAEGRLPHWLADFDFERFFMYKKDDEFYKEWIKGFEPRPIDVNKYLYLSFDENCRFIPVRIENGNPMPYGTLSVSEETIFHYLCFLEVNRFMFAYEKYKGYNCAKKPLFIFNFAEYLDESVDIIGLLKQATDLGCQVFLFTSGHELEGLKNKEEVVQILEK